MNSERIRRREDRMLRWERYLRRTRHVALGLAVLMIVGPYLFMLIEARRPDDDLPYTLLAGLFMLFWSYLAHLKIVHIETIKRNRSVGLSRRSEIAA